MLRGSFSPARPRYESSKLSAPVSSVTPTRRAGAADQGHGRHPDQRDSIGPSRHRGERARPRRPRRACAPPRRLIARAGAADERAVVYGFALGAGDGGTRQGDETDLDRNVEMVAGLIRREIRAGARALRERVLRDGDGKAHSQPRARVHIVPAPHRRCAWADSASSPRSIRVLSG